MRRLLSTAVAGASKTKVTFAKQDELSVLPIPSLKDTAARYIRAIESLSDLTKDELEWEKQAAAAFERQGEALQRQLEDFADQLHTSYINPFWTEMYMTGRWGLAVHSNPGTLSSCKSFEKSAPWPSKVSSSSQIQRAAQCIKATLDFLKSIEEETLIPDEFRGAPLDMHPYTLMFGTTRAPMKIRDVWVRSPQSRHITVLRDGEFFKVEVMDANRKPYSAVIIAKLLEKVVQDKSHASGPTNLAALTTLDRDTWSSTFLDLKSTCSVGLNAIGAALFHVALDEPDDALKTRNDLIRSRLHGNGRNRWFDQSFTLIVDAKGNVGSSFEHSWGDGLSMVRWANEIHHKISKWTSEDFGSEDVTYRSSMVEKLNFEDASSDVRKQANDALEKFNQLINQLDLESRVFADFGTDKLKLWRASPDGCFQQAIQLAYRRMKEKTVATYESCSTQTYLGGRTETIRSATPESHAFVKEMMDCLSSGDAERARLLRIAAKKHSEIALEAATGKGFDRHLFALNKLAQSKKLPIPDMMKGKGFALLQRNILSTSTVSQDYVDQAAFGPVVENGIGVCYHFFPDRIHFCITSYGGDAVEFSDKLVQALKDIGRLLNIQPAP